MRHRKLYIYLTTPEVESRIDRISKTNRNIISTPSGTRIKINEPACRMKRRRPAAGCENTHEFPGVPVISRKNPRGPDLIYARGAVGDGDGLCPSTKPLSEYLSGKAAAARHTRGSASAFYRSYTNLPGARPTKLPSFVTLAMTCVIVKVCFFLVFIGIGSCWLVVTVFWSEGNGIQRQFIPIVSSQWRLGHKHFTCVGNLFWSDNKFDHWKDWIIRWSSSKFDVESSVLLFTWHAGNLAMKYFAEYL